MLIFNFFGRITKKYKSKFVIKKYIYIKRASRTLHALVILNFKKKLIEIK